MTEILQTIVNPATILVAAFAGAWGAFLFESKRKAREDAEMQRTAANRALYTIYNMWNIMYQYHKEVASPYKGKSDSWLNMPANFAGHYGLISFDAVSLSFLLDGVHANIYSVVLLEEQRFGETVYLIEQRTNLLLNRVHPVFSAAKVQVESSLSEELAEKILGIDTVHQLRVWTPAIIDHVEKNIVSLRSAHDQLRQVMKTLYPDKKFLKIEFIDREA